MTETWAQLVLLALAAATEPSIQTGRGVDGTTIVVAPVTNAQRTSLRWVVRSGGASDPPGKAGLAHLLEHLIFHGSYTVLEHELAEATRKEGAYLNAFTTPTITVYVLDAPNRAFDRLARMFIEVITAPALTTRDLEQELGVIASESALRPGLGLLWVTDQLLFGGVDHSTVIGTSNSRRAIQLSDLSEFYLKYYIPSNTTVVLSGAVELDAMKRLVDESSRHAPDLPSERVHEAAAVAELPMEVRTYAWNTIAIQGYRLPTASRADCRALAEVLEYRLHRTTTFGRPLASEINVDCWRMRGQDFLFAIGVSRQLDAALALALKEAFVSLKDDKVTKAELRIVSGRRKARIRALRVDPAAWSDAIVEEVAAHPEPALVPAFAAEMSGAPSSISTLARRAFVEAESVSISLSPTGQ